MEKKIKFEDLSGWLKCAVVISWLFGFIALFIVISSIIGVLFYGLG